MTPEAFAEALNPGDDLWVFAYGSLMWDPGFEVVEQRRARLYGFHRRFCIYSHRYRGSPEQPGLVFGLDRGGSCRGLGLRVTGAAVPAVLKTLWQREMVNAVYCPRLLPVCLENGPIVSACAFVVDRTHRQYCANRDPAHAAALIRQGVGCRGRNIDYLVNTIDHLKQLGIKDRGLATLLAAVQSRDQS